MSLIVKLNERVEKQAIEITELQNTVAVLTGVLDTVLAHLNLGVAIETEVGADEYAPAPKADPDVN